MSNVIVSKCPHCRGDITASIIRNIPQIIGAPYWCLTCKTMFREKPPDQYIESLLWENSKS